MLPKNTFIQLYKRQSFGVGGAMVSAFLILTCCYMIFYTELDDLDWLVIIVAFVLAIITIINALKSMRHDPFYEIDKTQIKWRALINENFYSLNKNNGFHIFNWQDIALIDKRTLNIEHKFQVVHIRLNNEKRYDLPLNFLQI